MRKVTIAGVQMDVRFGNVADNVQRVCEFAEQAVARGAELIAFPECALTGYCVASLEEALSIGVEVDSPSLKPIYDFCRDRNVSIIVGLVERDTHGAYNSAACIGPSGLISRYRKIHLPFLGVDRFTTPGNQIEVFDVNGLKVGMNICYDCAFPEASRVMMLQGADLIALPTNWPMTSGRTADVIPNARALENNVYFMSVNRVGTEKGFSFVGKSKIVDPRGTDLAFANHTNEEIIVAEIDPNFARQKRIVNIPGEHEIDRLKDRCPQAYSLLTKQLSEE